MTIILTITAEVKLSKSLSIWRRLLKEIEVMMFMTGLEILILKRWYKS